MRRKLIATLRQKGISDERVLMAMEALPRHFFLERAFEEKAYEDIAFPIGKEQTISQPYTVAYQSQHLEIATNNRVLEIGTGSGYQAAILSLMGAHVYTIERQKMLHEKSRDLLKKIGVDNIRFFYKDGYKGLPSLAPFDKIIVTAGAPEIPKALLEQLKIGGIMIIPVGEVQQKMHKIMRVSQTEYNTQILENFKFVPFLKGVNE